MRFAAISEAIDATLRSAWGANLGCGLMFAMRANLLVSDHDTGEGVALDGA
jgi:hypothetical protein